MKPKKRHSFQPARPGTVLLVRQIIIGVMIASFFGLFLTSLWYGTRIDALTLSDVTVSGGETINHEEVTALVYRELEGSYLKIVPHTFAFTYPHDDIVSALKENRRIKDVTVQRPSGTQLAISFTEYVPHALWCKAHEEQHCFFLDETGYSFSVAPSLTGGSFLRLITIARDPADRVQALETTQYQVVHELVARLHESGWYVARVEVDGVGDAFFTIIEGGEFKISLKQAVSETMENLHTVLGSEKFSHLTPGNFEYVDLRFGSKVFVNEVTTVATSSIATSTPYEGESMFAATPTEAESDPTAPPDVIMVTVPMSASSSE